MSKKDSSSQTGKAKDAVVVDTEEPVVIVDETGAREKADPGADENSGEKAAAETEAGSAGQPDAGPDPAPDTADRSDGDNEPGPDAAGVPGEPANEAMQGESAAGEAVAAPAKPEQDPKDLPPKDKPPKPRRSWFGLFNFLLILAMAGAAGYYWWLEQQLLEDYRATIADLENRLESKVGGSRLDSSLSSVRTDIDSLGRKIGELETGQQGLRESSETLYELFGRDRADWQLAEVEYLMRVAQHKLILENDFAGAAVTLQAASDRIGLTGDPGLLPVRVTISEEIAELRTRERPDLVGMTLTLARLARQVRALEPGFAPRIDDTAADDGLPRVQPPEDWRDRVARFVDSLVEVRHESAAPTEIEASVANVGETLEDNLKLARWAVLDRDARQYVELIDASLRLMREFYDLDNAANHDFISELQSLQKMQLAPDKPDITGSLRQLQRILSQRENAPENTDGEPVDG